MNGKPGARGWSKFFNFSELEINFRPHPKKKKENKMVVATASQMMGWGLWTFRSRESYLLITMFRSLVQPHLDFCSPSSQQAKIEGVQKSLLSRIRDIRLTQPDKATPGLFLGWDLRFLSNSEKFNN